MPKVGAATDEVFSLRYGELEKMLNALLGTSGSVVVSRFRKLRPKFASDGLLTETGNKVSYDLTRVLAISAVYQLNSLSIPQGHAVDLVVSNWPEIARASLNARSLQSSKSAREHPHNAMVKIYINALAGGEKVNSWASRNFTTATGLPHVVLDLRPVVKVLAAEVEEPGEPNPGLVAAFKELADTFGWENMEEQDAPRLPQRLESDFFGTGPFFYRARAILAHNAGEPLEGGEALRLQAYLDYLEDPAPIDSWKRYIGRSPDEPRLIHVLAAWGADLGLRPASFGAEILKAASRKDRDQALEMIQQGEEMAAELLLTARAC